MNKIQNCDDLENAILPKSDSSNKLTGMGLLSRFQRKLSVQPRNCEACIRGRKNKKSKLYETTDEDSSAISLIEGRILSSGSSCLTSDSENERGRKVTKPANQNALENRRIDRIFQVLRKGRSLDLQDVDNVNKFRDLHTSRDKENRDIQGTSKPRCLERVRKLMERHNICDLPDYSATENKTSESKINNIPEATKLAFNIYSGRLKRASYRENVNFQISPLFQYNDGDRGEFYLFYKRILHYLLIRDAKATLKYDPNFLLKNKLTVNIRATLFDWMIKVQQYLRFQTETLHLAAAYVDHYTWCCKIVEKNYQLLGITALLLAAKVNERFPLSLRTLCYLTENSFIPKQILEQEQTMLSVLNFDVNLPIAHQFLGLAMLSCDDVPSETRDKIKLLCLYLFDLGLTEFELAKYTASIKCAAAVYLARRILMTHDLKYIQQKDHSSGDSYTASPLEEPSRNIEDCNVYKSNIWNSHLASFTGHDDCHELRKLVVIYASALRQIRELLSSLNNRISISTANFSQAAFIKYSNRKYARIARIPELMNMSCIHNFSEVDVEVQS